MYHDLLHTRGCALQGGDLMAAISNDSQNKLRWSRKGHTFALDIAKGLVHLHVNKASCWPAAM